MAYFIQKNKKEQMIYFAAPSGLSSSECVLMMVFISRYININYSSKKRKKIVQLIVGYLLNYSAFYR